MEKMRHLRSGLEQSLENLKGSAGDDFDPGQGAPNISASYLEEEAEDGKAGETNVGEQPTDEPAESEELLAFGCFKTLARIRVCPARYTAIGSLISMMHPKSMPDRTLCFLVMILLGAEVVTAGVLAPTIMKGMVVDERRCMGMNIFNAWPLNWTPRGCFLLLVGEEILTEASRRDSDRRIGSPVELRKKLVTLLKGEVCSLCLEVLNGHHILVPKCGHALHMGCLQTVVLMSNGVDAGKCRTCMEKFLFGNKVVRQYIMTQFWFKASLSVRKIYNVGKFDERAAREVKLRHQPVRHRSIGNKAHAWKSRDIRGSRLGTLAAKCENNLRLKASQSSSANDVAAETMSSSLPSPQVDSKRKDEEKNALTYLARRIAEELDVCVDPILHHINHNTDDIYPFDFFDD